MGGDCETGRAILNKGTRSKSRRAASWLLTIGWTALIGYMLLWPSEGTAVSVISGFFGGTNVTDAIGHFFMFLIEASLVYRLACLYRPVKNAQLIALVGGLAYGLLLEGAQMWLPTRGFAFLDLGANWSGVGVFLLLERLWRRAK